MKKIISIAFVLLFGLMSVSAQIRGSLTHNGLTRTYLVYLPTSYTLGSSLPIVFVLHALTQNGQRIMQVSGFNAIAEQNNFIAVYPDGIAGTWNVDFVPAVPDDVGFLDALADRMVTFYNADLTHLYACGLSNGGFMSYKLACESTKCFAAVASVAGVITDAAFATCTPARSVPVMHIHGTADGVVPYNGTVGFKSVNDVLAYWLFTNNNCSGNPTVTAFPNVNPFDLSTVDRFVWSPCDDGAEVQLLRVNGGGHQWPGTPVLLGGLGVINRDINASQEIWNFFRRFTCGQTAPNPIPAAPTVTASPPIVCLGTSSTLTATAPGGNYEWFTTAIAGTPIATGATFITPPLFVTTTYWVQTTISTRVSARKAVVVTVDPNPQPLAPLVTALPTALCGSGSSLLTSTLPALGTINWYDAATGGNLVGTGLIFTTPVLTATATYWAEPVRGNCMGPRTAVTVTVNPVPAAPTVAPQTVCFATAATLTATAPGGIYSWYTTPVAGLPVWIGASYTTPQLSANTRFFVETIANGCSSQRAPVIVTVIPRVLPPKLSASPAVICAGVSTTLSAMGTTAGVVDWYSSPTAPTPVATGLTYTTPALNFRTTFWATVTVNGCSSVRTPITVYVLHALPPLVTALPPVVCTGGTSVLTVANPTGGTIKWYDAATGGNLLGMGLIFTTPPATATATFYTESILLSGCVSQRTATTVVLGNCKADETASVSAESEFLHVYPNPTNGIFKIDFRTLQPQKLRIFDVTGKTVIAKDYLQSDTQQFSESIDLSGMSPGLYFIQVMSESGTMNGKVSLNR